MGRCERCKLQLKPVCRESGRAETRPSTAYIVTATFLHPALASRYLLYVAPWK